MHDQSEAGWIEANLRHSDFDGLVRQRLSALALEQRAGSARELGSLLWHRGKSYLAVDAFELAFALGEESENFIMDFVGLLTGEMVFDKLQHVCERVAPRSSVHLKTYLSMLSGQAALAQRLPLHDTVAFAKAREDSAAWLGAEEVLRHLHHHVQEKIPLSLVRVGDGEAKALVYYKRNNISTLTQDQAIAIGNNIWRNWFGQNITDFDCGRLDQVFSAYFKSIKCATILGVVASDRFRSDTAHYGYMSFQDEFIRQIGPSCYWTNSMVHYQLNAIDPFLRNLLDGRSVSFISPHDQLAVRYAKLNASRPGLSIVVPGERRLPEDVLSHSAAPHLPTVFDEVCDRLRHESEGRIFLVAAGFLGKIYCGLIETYGGIAIDVGSIVDGWMGYNTRPGHLDHARTLL